MLMLISASVHIVNVLDFFLILFLFIGNRGGWGLCLLAKDNVGIIRGVGRAVPLLSVKVLPEGSL